MNKAVVFSVGFLAQILFSARFLVQWISSEKAGRVLAPLLFWQLSILASFLMIVYGILRHDLAILFGQAITYGIYIRNLHYLGFWAKIPAAMRGLFIAFPVLAIVSLLVGERYSFESLLTNEDIPLLLLIWGLAGQFIFTFRFVVQWLSVEKKKESVLPIGFWIFSITGSLMVLSYAVIRRDPVLFVGQLFGFTVYIRNIVLWARHRALPGERQ